MQSLRLARRRPAPSCRYGPPRPARNRGWRAHAVRTALAAVSVALFGLTAAAEEQVTILALGDSLTQGYGLPQQDGFTPVLEAWLRANGAPHATVLNGGVSGDTTAGGLARLDWSLTPEVDAVIVALGGNDLLRGVDPAASRANLQAIMKSLAARGLPAILTGMRAPPNYGPDWKREFDAMYPELAADYGAIYDPYFLAGLEGDPTLAQPDGIHPSARGVKALVARFGPIVLELIARVRAGGA